MKIMKKIGLFVGALLVAAGLSPSFAQATDVVATPTTAQLKVAVVNVQQVLQQSPRVSELSKKLEAQFKTRQTKINDEQKALQDELDKMKKESPTMSQKDRDAMQKKVAAERADLVKQVVAYQQDLQKEQNRIMQSILNDLNGIVSGIAKNQNYALVLDSQAVIFAPDGNDITKDVSSQFNAKG
ncbi:MAG: OmpH family outer membrane protein [Gammaproteobacteria bacterium]|nr:OmpH family outer membrane protein [Gammaproteobacteria bacterium]